MTLAVIVLSILLVITVGLLVYASRFDAKIIDDQASQIRHLATVNNNWEASNAHLKRQNMKLQDEKVFDLTKMNDDEIKKLISNLPPKLKAKLRKLQNTHSVGTAEVTAAIKNIDFHNHDIF
jgi:predicted PurR-regulated permease PerM